MTDYFEITPWGKGIILEAGKCYSGMPNETYHSLKEWSGSTDFKHVLRSVESYYYQKAQKHRNSLALERGAAFHVGIESLADNGTLSLFNSQVVPFDGKTVGSKAWETAKKENDGYYVLPKMEFDNVIRMAGKVYDKASELYFFDEGYPELSFFWIDPETGIKCKCRPDWLRLPYMYDYKSSKNHQEELFKKDIANLLYHFSCAMYCEGVFQVTGVNTEHFYYLTVANTEPNEVECYELNDDSRLEGKMLFRKILTDIKNYNPKEKLKIKQIEIPYWGFKMLEV